MSSKEQKTTNPSYTKTAKNYELHRKFIRNLAIYCYRSRQEYGEINIAGRTYDNYIRGFLDCIDRDFIKVSTRGKEKVFRFNADMYKSSYNHLVSTYFTKSLTKNTFYCIIILQILSKGDSLTKTEIADAIAKANDDKQLDISPSTLNRALGNLTDSGLLKESKKKNKEYYQLADNILDQLTENELLELYNAVSFFRNVSLLSVPGYYLANTISQYLENHECDCPEKNSLWQYRFCNYSKIVDDEVVYNILQSMENKKDKYIEINYVNKKSDNSIWPVPEALSTDYPYGRTYMLTTEHEVKKVEKITKSQLKDFKKLDLIFTFKATDNERKVTTIKHRLQKEAACMHCTELDKEHYRYTATVLDALSLVPWIRSFHKYVSLGSDTDEAVKKLFEKDKPEKKNNKTKVIYPKKVIRPATNQKGKKPSVKKLDLIFTFKATDDEREVTAIKHRLQNEAAWMHCTELDKEHYRYTATVQDALSFVPWIRTFHKYVSLGSDTDTVVKERLEKDKLEALQKYGII